MEGMHCPSCELLIEKKLLESEDIGAVEASVKNGRVVVFYKHEKPEVAQLNKKFKEDGYSFFLEPQEEKRTSPLFSLNKSGVLLINKSKFVRLAQVLAIVVLLLTSFILLSRSGIASRVVVSSTSALSAFFLFGLIAGASSCAALVGGLVLSMSKQWGEIYQSESSFWQRFQPHLLFNLGRLLAFGFLGALLGYLGASLGASLSTSSLLVIGVSVMMVLFGLQMLGVKRFQKFQITMPKFISRYVADETNFKGRYMPFILGALTFFLPCGFTITAQGLALTSGSVFQGAGIMFFFALGTLPMLGVIGLSSLKLTSKPHLSDKFLKVAGILVLFFGLYNFNSQLNVFGLPSLDDINPSFGQNTRISADNLTPLVNGKQVIKMAASAYGYQPDYFQVKAGIPVRWEITNQGVSGCTNAIVSRGLFDGEIRLDDKLNVKEFTPREPGQYKFSCWMGMISGTIEVVDPALASEPGVAAFSGENSLNSLEEIPSGASGCGGGGSGGGCTGGCGGGCGNPGCPYAR